MRRHVGVGIIFDRRGRLSLSDDPRVILCDGEACDATTQAPVTLSRGDVVPGDTSANPVQDWLFVVVDQDEQRHYCPRCALIYLRTL